MAERKFVPCLIGMAVSVAATLVFALIFAALVKLFGFSENVIRPINQVIKMICVLFGCLVCVKERNGALKGLAFGVVYIILTNVLFSILRGSFDFGLNALWELLFGAAIGTLSGVIAVLVRK